jgi:dienelactone hydrolase
MCYVRDFVSILLFAPFLLVSCHSGDADNEATSAPDTVKTVTPRIGYDASLAKGIIVDSLTCGNADGGGFGLYLPVAYDTAKALPCIYFFDAHARGSLPLRLYKRLADKYGVILIGSNTSKNGMPIPETTDLAKALIADTRSRIAIDGARIYTAGFSGGARVAASLAIVDNDIAGVIGCAGGFQQGVEITRRFYYSGIVGRYDFNLTEMELLDDALGQNGFTHQLIIADGTHNWASERDFETALAWMFVQSMNATKHLEGIDSLARNLANDYRQRVTKAYAGRDYVEACRLLGAAADISIAYRQENRFKAEKDSLIQSQNYKDAVTAQHALQQEELHAQQDLSHQLSAQATPWWKDKIANLHQERKEAGATPEADMYERLVKYLGLLGYMYTTHAFKSGNIDDADRYLDVFKMADPTNPDCSYLRAIFYMQKGDQHKALAALTEAVTLGYSDPSELNSEPAFNVLANDAAFRQIKEKVAENYRTKN